MANHLIYTGDVPKRVAGERILIKNLFVKGFTFLVNAFFWVVGVSKISEREFTRARNNSKHLAAQINNPSNIVEYDSAAGKLGSKNVKKNRKREVVIN